MYSVPKLPAADHGLPSKPRLMCSYDGHIFPSPHKMSLCYVGDETCPFTLKYQLHIEDLDSLITVSTDEDLGNMIDDHDRIIY
ncbi:hypothetical protein CDL15_Pgr025116 [Punica granatum]|uniref:PB1 domain-containing protein n=1 Tax=Punica granatum TaxID=22663 RepID=A0A218W8V6_PUNGR|nr:hypothetical protein CDL15_Pgr025116 [Punica granatum]